MVASYSKKKSKYTYAERVVGALSQIQREHKKHAVHIATLRAQVRKNAQDQKDKLGPQWSNWVSRAVTKLEDQGVLESSGASNVTFTAEAKKALTSARRESMISPSSLFRAGVSSPEDLVLKQVAQADFTRGLKRQRRRSSAVQPRYISEVEDEAPSASFSASTRRRSIGTQKKARRQSSGKALSKMTRAELQAELRTTQAQSGEVTSDETIRLQEELEQARRQLAEAQEQLASPMRASRMGDSRPHTPKPPSALSAAQTATKTGPHRGILCGLTRTESGSLINQYSKQPTPAPSSPGGHDFDMEDESPPSPVAQGHDDVFTISHGLATPSSSVPYNEDTRARQAPRQQRDNDMPEDEIVDPGSPLSPLESRRELELEDQVSSHLRRVEELQTQLREQSGLLATKDAALATEQTRVEELQQTVAELEASLEDKDATIVKVQELLSNVETLSTALRSDMDAQNDRHDSRLNDLRTDMASYEVYLEEEKQRARTSAQELANEKSLTAGLSDENATLQADYAALQDEVAGVRATLEDALLSVGNLTTRCTDAEARHSRADLHCSELTEQASLLRAELSVVSTQRIQVTNEKNLLELGLANAMGQVESLGIKLAAATTDLERSRASETALELKISSLQEAHATGTVTLETLRDQSDQSKATIDRLQQELQAATDHSGDLATQIQGHQARQGELENFRTEANQQLDTLALEATSTKTKISELELTIDELTYNIQSKDDDLKALHAAVQEKETLRASLQAQLSSLQADHAALGQTLAEQTEQTKMSQAEVAILNARSADLCETLDAEICQRATESAEYADEISRLQASIREREGQAAQAAAAAEEVRNARQLTIAELQETQAHLQNAHQDFAVAQTQISSLTRQVEDVRTRATDAEQEIEDLRSAKLADEKNILELREIFAGLREAQMKSLAEVENKMASAQFSPMPPRRPGATLSEPIRAGKLIGH